MPEPNHYQVHLRWAPIVIKDTRGENKTWMLYRAMDSQPLAPYMTLKPEQTEIIDPEVEAGATYTYLLGFLTGAELTGKESIKVTVPKDLVVTKLIRANTLTEYRRIFIEKAGIIETMGERLELIADELHSDSGTIQTYGNENLAPQGFNGRTPEILVIQVKRAFGNLNIQAIGQTGGKGLPGDKGAKGAPGRNGERAVSTVMRFSSRDGGSTESNPICGDLDKAVGKTGHQGGVGRQGGIGATGGNSPRVYVRIEQVSEIDIKVDKIIGKGGEGGDGGPGGDGGEGGEKGIEDIHGACRAPRKGDTGPNGPQGPKGNPGMGGLNNSPSCIKISNKEEGACSLFLEKNGFVL